MSSHLSVYIGPYFEAVKEIEFVVKQRTCPNEDCKEHGRRVGSAEVFCSKCGTQISSIEKIESYLANDYKLCEKFGFSEDALFTPQYPGNILLPNMRVKNLSRFKVLDEEDVGHVSLEDLSILEELKFFKGDFLYGPIIDLIKDYAVLRYGIVKYAH